MQKQMKKGKLSKVPKQAEKMEEEREQTAIRVNTQIAECEQANLNLYRNQEEERQIHEDKPIPEAEDLDT